MTKGIVVSIIKNKYDSISTNELPGLLKVLNIEVIETFIFEREPTPKYLIGSGKVVELNDIIKNKEIQIVVFNNSLSGKQIRNLENVWGIDVVDRSFIILQIFAQNAKTHLSMLEVDLALKRYMLPRLGGNQIYSSLSRQGGGYYAKGPGETKLETDQRVILRDIYSIKKKIESLKTKNQASISNRKRTETPIVSLVGYTNAGKSSLFNSISEHFNKSQLVETKNQYFTTLGTKYASIKGNAKIKPFILVDSVGFISNIPTELIDSFYSTLDSVKEADLILYIENGSLDETISNIHRKVSFDIINQISETKTQIIIVKTHKDLIKYFDNDTIYISNTTKEGISELIDLINFYITNNEKIYEIVVSIIDYKMISFIKSNFRILNEVSNIKTITFRLSLTDKQVGLIEKMQKK